MRILGIDPGSRIAGYGLLDAGGSKMHYLASGCIHAKADTYIERIREIFIGIQALTTQYQPDTAVIEKAFVAKNADSALKLGQVRGLVLSIFFENEIDIHEYSPKTVKKAVTGLGNADKTQVQFMTKRLLNLSGTPPEDAADALALAICHLYQGQKL